MLKLLIASLAVFRLSILFSLDGGPFGMFRRLRSWLKREAKEHKAVKASEIHKGVECIRCSSVWYASLVALYHLSGWSSPWVDGLILTLALSGAAILWVRAFPPR